MFLAFLGHKCNVACVRYGHHVISQSHGGLINNNFVAKNINIMKGNIIVQIP
jgi:hypothetical protein